MYPKLSSEEYSYTFSDAEQNGTSGVEVVLTQTSTGKTKKFFCAGKQTPCPRLHGHMNSLTDDLCSSWFNERPPKKKKNENS